RVLSRIRGVSPNGDGQGTKDSPHDPRTPLSRSNSMRLPNRPLVYVDPQASHGMLSRTLIRLLGTRPMLAFERSLVWRIVGWRLVPRLVRLTGGRLGGKMPLPAALLETMDTRNGRIHHRVVFYFHDGGNPTIIATKGGLSQD